MPAGMQSCWNTHFGHCETEKENIYCIDTDLMRQT